jgi:hypothetical protein
MIIDLKNLSPKDREDLLKEAGEILHHIPYPNLHPDRPSSMHFYEIVIEEDILQTARRKRLEEQNASSS